MKHGETYRFPSGFRTRWCEKCNTLHGYLYDCAHFPDDIRQAIQKEDQKRIAAISVSIAILVVFVILAGL